MKRTPKKRAHDAVASRVAWFGPTAERVAHAIELTALQNDPTIVDALLESIDAGQYCDGFYARDGKENPWHFPPKQNESSTLCGPHLTAILGLLPFASAKTAARLRPTTELRAYQLSEWFLPEDLSALENLESLVLCGPYGSKRPLPAALGQLPLQTLELANTGLSTEHFANIEFGPHLVSLVLSHNQLTVVPLAFRDAVGLVELRIDSNQLLHLPDWLRWLPSFTRFNASRNHLQWVVASLTVLEAILCQEATRRILSSRVRGTPTEQHWKTRGFVPTSGPLFPGISLAFVKDRVVFSRSFSRENFLEETPFF